MKKVFLITLFVLSAVIAFAQDCYNYTRSLGISYYDKGQYSVAKSQFSAAKSCPDKPSNNDLDTWIKKCDDAIVEANRKAEEEKARQQRAEAERKMQEEAKRQEEARRQEASNRAKGYMYIREITFGTRGAGETTSNFYTTLDAASVRYLVPRICYDGLGNESKEIKLYVKIFEPDGTLSTGENSPYGYSFSRDITVYTGKNNYCSLTGWGSDKGGSYDLGTYRIELWYEGKMIYKQNFTLTGSKDLKINSIKFGTSGVSTSASGYYSKLGAADVKYLRPRVYYDGLVTSSKSIRFFVKIINPDGTLKYGETSPNGYTYYDDITISPGKNHYCNLTGWGNDSGTSYKPGTYSIELWQNGGMVYKQNFTLTDTKDLIINDIKFGTEGEGESANYFYSTLNAASVKYLVPRIYYDGIVNGSKSVRLFVKIINPDGTLKSGSTSPYGYSYYRDVTISPGENNYYTLTGWGTASGGSYKPGTYNIEIWYDGKMLYKQNFKLY